MDTRTGQMYPSAEAAMAAGVPQDKLVRLRYITKGPFKGRVYEERADGGLGQRRKDVEARKAMEAEIAARERQLPHRNRAVTEVSEADLEHLDELLKVRDEVTRNPRATD